MEISKAAKAHSTHESIEHSPACCSEKRQGKPRQTDADGGRARRAHGVDRVDSLLLLLILLLLVLIARGVHASIHLAEIRRLEGAEEAVGRLPPGGEGGDVEDLGSK